MSNSVKKSRISENMFNSLFKSFPFPSYVWKIVENDLILIEYNTSAEKITNGQIKNDLGRKASDIYKDQSEFYEGLSRCASYKCRVSKEIKTIYMTTGEEIFISVEFNYVPPDLVLVHTEDITDRKESEQKLKREEKKAGLYLDLAGVIIVTLNTKGEITLLNKKGYEVLEYEEGELMFKNWFETCVPIHLRTQVLDVFNKLIRGDLEPVEFYENPIITKNGNEKIIAWHNTLLYDDDGQIIGTLSSGEDITPRKKAEEALKASQERLKRLNLELEQKVEERTKQLWKAAEDYRLLVEHAPVGVFLADQEGNIKLVNPLLVKILGSPSAEATKQINLLTFPLLKKAGVSAAVEQCFEKKESNISEFFYKSKWGKDLYCRLYLNPVRDAFNQIIGIQGIIEDITEYKIIEQKIRESEEQYRTMINSLADPLEVVDRDLKILLINPAFESWLEDLSIEKDVVGQTIFEAFPFLSSEIRKDYKQIFDTGEIQYTEGSTFVDGKEIITETRRIPIFKEGHVNQVLVITRDITKRKSAEMKISESEERLSAFINSAPDSIFIWDSELNLVDCNKNGFNMISMGQKREDLIGQNMLAIAPDVKGKGRYDKYMKVIKTGKPFYIDGVVPHPKFGDIIISIRAFKVGDMLGMITTDITKRKKAEQELIESEENYRLLTENINDLIVVINTKFQIEYVNEEVVNKLEGNTKKDILGKNILDFVHPDDKVKSLNLLLKGIKDKEGSGEMRVANLKGQYIWFEAKGGAFLNTKGELKGILIARDITERKQAEEKLRESEERYRTLVETMTDGLAVIDENNCFTYANIGFIKMIGYSYNELLSTHVFNYLDKKNQSIVEEQLIERRKGKAQPYELVWTRKDGQKVYTILAPKPLTDAEGNYIGSFGVITNITDRIIAEKKTKESEAKYRNLFESSPTMIVLLNPNGKIIDVNPAALTQYGFERSDFIDKDFRVLNNYLPGNLPILAKKFKKLLTKGILEPIELPFHTKDRNIIWVNIQGSLVKIGGETYIQTVIQDINERKEAELKIKESEEKFRSLIETTSDWIWEVDENGVYTYASPKIKDILGYNIEEVIGKTPFDFMPPNEAERVHELFQEVIQSNEPLINIENKNLHKDGSLIMLETSGVPFFYTDGKLQGYRGIDRDITEKKEAEQELIESEEKYRQLFENSPEIIVLANPDGVILEYNSAAENAFGFSKDEVIGRHYFEFGVFNSDQISILNKRYKETLREKQKNFEEFKVNRKDGSSFWILYQSTIVKLGNKPYILTLAQDITEIKKAEKLIEEELIKLKKLDDIKNELITRVSHEFKTPLTSILGSAELFLNLFKGVYTEEMKQLIEIIFEGGKRLENLIKKTIDISLIESKNISFRREREDIGKLINNCVNNFVYLADKRELILELNVQENLFIQIDKNKIIEVIKNILSNAIKNTPPKGIILISLNGMKEHVEISIKDSGVGLTAIELQRIFQKFGKIERYGKDFDVDIEGPGLGLYLAKKFIEMHGGNIWAESEGLNKGATFIIELPIK